MKKIIVLIILMMMLTAIIYTTAKPPYKDPPNKDKPDNPNKGKGKNKDNNTTDIMTNRYYFKVFGGEITIEEEILYYWSNWLPWWKITNG